MQRVETLFLPAACNFQLRFFDEGFYLLRLAGMYVACLSLGGTQPGSYAKVWQINLLQPEKIIPVSNKSFVNL